MKLFVFDLETTGLDPKKNGILTLSGDVYYNGALRDCIHLEMQPFEEDEVDDYALEVNGIKDYSNWLLPNDAYGELLKFFDKHILKWDKKDKFYGMGYNSRFDYNFLDEFFKKNKNNYLGSYLNPRYLLDVYELVKMAVFMGKIPQLPDLKLGTVASHFEIKFGAHTSQEDIRCTYQLYERIKSILRGES